MPQHVPAASTVTLYCHMTAYTSFCLSLLLSTVTKHVSAKYLSSSPHDNYRPINQHSFWLLKKIEHRNWHELETWLQRYSVCSNGIIQYRAMLISTVRRFTKWTFPTLYFHLRGLRVSRHILASDLLTDTKFQLLHLIFEVSDNAYIRFIMQFNAGTAASIMYLNINKVDM